MGNSSGESHATAWQEKPTVNAFTQRALVALTLGPILLIAAYFGGWFFFIPVAALFTLATIEYTQLMRGITVKQMTVEGLQTMDAQSRERTIPTSAWLLVPAVLALLAAAQFGTPPVLSLVLFVSLVMTLGYALLLFESGQVGESVYNWLGLWGGLLLLGWIGSYFFLLRDQGPDGWQWTALAMVSNWTADSGAFLVGSYLAGKVIGRHQLSPRLSPKKTVEGFVGSVLAGTGAAAVMASLLHLPLALALLIGLAIALVSPIGDLGISLLKRRAGVKDSGKLFPGHGGALDRLDSLIWSIAITYYLLLFFGQPK
jgi:phosphatidate cytidylyltransferase